MTRSNVRYAVQCPVDFVVDGKPGRGVIFNLSFAGCAIESDLNTAPGDPVSLQITVSDQSRPLSVELGKVRWATRREFGVEFMVVTGGSQQHLDEFLMTVAKREASV